MHLLIIDDDLVFCEILKKSLADFGHITISDSAVDAAKKINSTDFDLLICDYYLPDGNGLDLIRQGKIKCTNQKSILMSGGTTKEIAIASVNSQISALIEKPFLSSDIKKIINELMPNKTVRLCERDYKATIHEHIFSLTPIEFKLFKLLYENPEKRMSRNKIIKQIWPNTEVSDNSFDTHLGNIKKKMGKYSDMLSNIKGVGYSLNQSN